MDVVLTDDEIAAVALEGHLAWPVPLPTVVTDIDHLAAAATRGRRSLLVRGLATPSDSGVEVAADIIATLEQAVSSRCLVAWVASLDAPAVLAGSSTVIYRRPDGDLIDLTSAIGIHDLRAATTAIADAIVGALAKNVFDFGFAGPTDPAARLMVGAFGEGPVLLVSEGAITSGVWAAESIKLGSKTDEWSPALIEQALA